MGWLRSLGSDLRQSWRALAKRPGMTSVAVLTVALAIGAGASVFAIVNAILLQPLPYKDPDRLVMAWNVNPQAGYTYETAKMQGDSMSPAEVVDWRDSGIFQSLALFSSSVLTISDDENPEMTHGYFLSEGGFDMLGVQPSIGRLPTLDEERAGGPRVVVLLDSLWQRRFHGDPNVLDQTIDIYGIDYRIIGVMPPNFLFFNRQSELLGALQLPAKTWTRRSPRAFRVMGRLADGLTIEQAQARATQFSQTMAERLGAINEGWTVLLYPVAEDAAGALRTPLLALLGAVGLLLLIMCGNLASLLLVHATARGRELAVRAALGAGRWRLVRVLMGESLLIALAGGVLGLGLTFGIVRAFQGVLPDRFTHGRYLLQLESIRVDPWVIAFGFAAALVAGLLFGALPALRSSRPDINQHLKESGRGSSGGVRMRGVHAILIVAEVAFSVVLVTGAALLVRSFSALYERGPGLQPDRLLTMLVQPPLGGIYADLLERGTPREQLFAKVNEMASQVEDETLRRVRAVPGIESVAAVDKLPMQGWFTPSSFSIEGRSVENTLDQPSAQVVRATGNYFATISVPLLRGRTFGPEDRIDSPPVCIISDELARRYFASGDPVGRRIKLGDVGSASPWMSIVGVVGSLREAGMRGEPTPAIYTSHAQQHAERSWFILKSRASTPLSLLQEARSAIRQVDSRMPIYRVRTMADIVHSSTWQLESSMMLLSGLAGLALVLAVVGLYGVLSYTVRQQTREIGVRMALGADRNQLLTMVLANGMKLVALGLLLGALAAMALTRFLASLLYGIEPLDAPTFGLAALVLLLAGAAASYLPARRATAVSAMEALRHE
ncbi:MAG: ABC transporter permease [Bryobacterales bacterium]|nr:ABC transporter permease [Acidobacteriota bacterium]MCB9384048.1 ABC transporter permease [Bryobacterales bacterium]